MARQARMITKYNCQYWRDNRDSMLNFLLQVHAGVKGIVRNEEEEPLVKATVAVGKMKPVKTTNNGEYWKLILPGNYSVVSVALDAFSFDNQIIYPVGNSRGI